MTDTWRWFTSGGDVMAALALVGVVLFFLILERFLATGARIRSISMSTSAVSSVSRGPAESLGAAGEPGPGVLQLAGLRRMGLIRACIVIAPLLGLLGTVTGIIETFESILRGGYITEMSEGIRKALLTTQYGLAIAAPGLVAEHVLLRRLERLERMLQARRLVGTEGRRCGEAS